MRELLAGGANLEAVTNNDLTPLILASWMGRVDVVRALLAVGADKRHVGFGGRTAAMVAGMDPEAPPLSHAAVLALLAAAP